MKKLLVILATMVILLSFVACSATNTTASNSKATQQTTYTPMPTKEPTAYDLLNETETKVFSAIKAKLSSFKSPASVRVIDVRKGKCGADDTEKNTLFVRISANNSFGGTVTDDYVVKYGSLTDAGSAWYSVAGTADASASKINAALQEYYASQGWN